MYLFIDFSKNVENMPFFWMAVTRFIARMNLELVLYRVIKL